MRPEAGVSGDSVAIALWSVGNLLTELNISSGKQIYNVRPRRSSGFVVLYGAREHRRPPNLRRFNEKKIRFEAETTT